MFSSTAASGFANANCLKKYSDLLLAAGNGGANYNYTAGLLNPSSFTLMC